MTSHHTAKDFGLWVLVLAISLVGCATPQGATGSEKRAAVRHMRDTALADLYQATPELENAITRSKGYAVFSNASLKLLYVGGGHGYGIAVDTATGDETFMRMAEVGVGLGIGAKDYRNVFIFTERATFEEFVNRGWTFGGQASAAAKSDEKGAGVGGELPANFGMEVYQLTEAGLVADAMVTGTKYWKDKALNE